MLAATMVAVTAPAASAHEDGGGWVPTSTPPFRVPAGVICPFEVRGDIVADDERMRTLAAFPDGTARVQDFEGRLVIRFVNTSNGHSAVRDATGRVRAYTFVDGTLLWQIHGNAAVPVRRPNTPALPPGDYIVRGDFVLVIHPDHTKELPVRLGTMEDMCRTIA
ncbi:MAG TPA: hypothetical protein VJT31_07520 [Rugosimonospora sp.]|nr:hypothetical protein [Rugosimonospora sp.]